MKHLPNVNLWQQLLTAILLAISSAASSSSNAFQPTAMLESQTLQMCNSAKIKVMGLFNVGSAALYLQDCSRGTDQLNQPIQLSIIYKRNFSAQEFQDSAYKLLQRNLSKAEFANIEDELQRFNGNYQKMTKGERYDICYSEKTGLLLHKNGALISQSQSSELGKSYFRIWFGERPFSKSLKKKLLSSLDRVASIAQ